MGKFDRVWIRSENYDNSIVIWDRVSDRGAQLEGDGVQFLGGGGLPELTLRNTFTLGVWRVSSRT